MKRTSLILFLFLVMPLNSAAYYGLPDEQSRVMYASNADGDAEPQAYLVDEQPREPRDLDEQLDRIEEKVISLSAMYYVQRLLVVPLFLS